MNEAVPLQQRSVIQAPTAADGFPVRCSSRHALCVMRWCMRVWDVFNLTGRWAFRRADNYQWH
jgi:hypothetical protein